MKEFVKIILTLTVFYNHRQYMLQIENIKLRAVEPEDIDFILDMENDIDLWNVSNTHNPFSRFDIEQYVMLADKDIYSAKQVRYIIEDLSNLSRIGMVDVFDFDAHNRRAGIGILLVKEARKKWAASITLKIIINYLFEQLSIHQVYCNINATNTDSIKLFESQGFTKIGLKKDWNLVNSNWVDVGLYQLINSNQ